MEDGEYSSQTSDEERGRTLSSVVTNTAGKHDKQNSDSEAQSRDVEPSTKSKRHKARKKSRYQELEKRFSMVEQLLQKMVENQSGQNKENQPSLSHSKASKGTKSVQLSDTESDDDAVSLFACGQISENESTTSTGAEKEQEVDREVQQPLARVGLFDMFGEDAMVKKEQKKEGIVLDAAQIEAINHSYRCSQPNFLTAFSEDNYDIFSVDADSEKYLQVPSLDNIIDSCLTKRYGGKASFVKGKGKSLHSQPCKMVEKIGFKGQQAARLALVMQLYIQQSLGNHLQTLQSEDFDKEKAVQQIRDIFAMSTKCVDQIGRAGAFHHIIRRTVALTDTGLYEQPDNLAFSNLPLTGDGVFGAELEPLLKSLKEKRKQVDELIPDVKKGIKRKMGTYSETNKRTAYDKFSDKTPAASGTNWNNFRIPRLPRDNYKRDDRQAFPARGRGTFGSRRPAGSGRGKLAKTDEK